MLNRLAAAWKRRTSSFSQLAFVCGVDYRYDDVDSLSVSYPYTGFDQLVSMLSALGLTLAERPANPGHLDNVIPQHPVFLQPKFVTVLGVLSHVLIAGDFITVSVRAVAAHLTGAEVDRALALDQRLDKLNFPRRERPLTMSELLALTQAPNADA